MSVEKEKWGGWLPTSLTFLLVLCVSSVSAQDDQFLVATGFGSVVRVFKVTASGEISLNQTLNLGHGSEQLELDTGGRFVFFDNNSGPTPNDIMKVAANGDLVAGTVFGPPAEGFSVSAATRLIPVRNSLLVYSANQSNLAEVRIYDATVNNRLQVRFVGDFLDVTGTAADSPMDAVASAFDPYSFLVSVFDQAHAQIIRLDPSGVLTLTSQSYTGQVTPFARPSRDGSGRLIAFNQQFGNDLGIGRFTGDGMSTFVIADVIDIPNLSDSINTAMHPTGRWAFVSGAGGVFSVELNDMGEFVRVVGDPAPGGGTAMAISTDGRFLFTGSAHLIRVNDDGSLTGLGDVEGVPSLSDIAWIPPRTPPTILGDVNLDGRIDAADVVFLVNEAMPDDKPILLPQNFANADLDGDVDVDQDDLEALVELLLQR